jgi:hypothetical protein
MRPLGAASDYCARNRRRVPAFTSEPGGAWLILREVITSIVKGSLLVCSHQRHRLIEYR